MKGVFNNQGKQFEDQEEFDDFLNKLKKLMAEYKVKTLITGGNFIIPKDWYLFSDYKKHKSLLDRKSKGVVIYNNSLINEEQL